MAFTDEVSKMFRFKNKLQLYKNKNMKKKLIGVIVLVAIAVVATWNYNHSKKEINMSDLALANVEALAINEGADWVECYYAGCISTLWADCWLFDYGIPVKFCPDSRSA